jgi:hypothetical protein
MKQTPKTIATEIRRLQKIQRDSNDPIEVRLAYVMSETLRWATLDTRGWPKPHKNVAFDVECLKREIMPKSLEVK